MKGTNPFKGTPINDISKPSDILPIQIPSKSLGDLIKEREKIDEECKNMYLTEEYQKKIKYTVTGNHRSEKEIKELCNNKKSLTEKYEDLKFERSMSSMNIGGPKRSFSEISSSTTWQDNVIKREIKKKRQDEEDLVKEYVKNNKYYYYKDGDCYISYDIHAFRLILEPRVAKRRRNKDKLIYDGNLLIINDKITSIPYNEKTNEFNKIKYKSLTLDKYHQKYCEKREDGAWYYKPLSK